VVPCFTDFYYISFADIPAGIDPKTGIPASDEDLRIGMYEPSQSDWPPHGHQEAQCQKISTLLEQVMALAISEAFLTPVDLNLYPEYATTIEYFMDLSTIKARLDNLFYRRVDALKFDLKYIAMNAEKFNKLDSDIVKNSRVVRDVCLEITHNPDSIDVNAVYHRFAKHYSKKEQKKSAKKGECSSSSSKSNKTSSSKSSKRLQKKQNKRQNEHSDSDDDDDRTWEQKCMQIWNDLWERDDATPFREPVDITQFPDYFTTIETPMSLQTVKEELLGGNYETPQDFHKDMIMIFHNSRLYNTDHKSPIFVMTRRLQSLYESMFQKVMKSIRGAGKGGSKKSSKSKQSERTSSRQMPTRSSSRANSTPRKNPKRSAATNNRYLRHDDDSSDAGASDHHESGHNLRTRNNRRRSVNARRNVPRENGRVKRALRNGHNGSYSNNNNNNILPKTNGYASSSPKRQSSRVSLGTRPVKRLRISSGESHPSTRNSPRRSVASNRLSNTSSHGSGSTLSTPPDGPSTSRAAAGGQKRVKIQIKEEHDSDEFEDSEEPTMPILNEVNHRDEDQRMGATLITKKANATQQQSEGLQEYRKNEVMIGTIDTE
jgi:hypothetical protein